MRVDGFAVALCAADVYCLFEACLMRASTTSKLSNHSMSLKCFDCLARAKRRGRL